jgi:hypothetical protein
MTRTKRCDRALIRPQSRIPPFTLLLAALTLLFWRCTAPSPPHRLHQLQIIEYTVLWVDSSQGVFKQCGRPAPKAKSRFTPTSVQVDTLFGDLKRNRAVFEKALPLPLEQYLYQVVGFDADLLYLNCFASSSYHGIPNWRAAPIVECGGGGLYWGVVYNIQRRTFDRFFKNGGSPP